jgi:hypothetical protein
MIRFPKSYRNPLADSRLAIPSAGCRFFTGRSGGACVARGVNGWSALRVLAEISLAKTGFSADSFYRFVAKTPASSSSLKSLAPTDR